MQSTQLDSDYYSEPIPNGHLKKHYNQGITISGTWARGMPQGKFDYHYQDISTQITFKNGLINRIHTSDSQLTIYFPYKYLQCNNSFIEYEDEEANSYYSVLRVNFFHKAFEKPINRKLGQIKRFQFLLTDYFGEFSYGNIPHGFGIKSYDLKMCLIGNFSAGFPHGKGMRIDPLREFKGQFNCSFLDGEGTEKDLETGLKYKGNFKDFRKHGPFNVFLKDFRLECSFNLNYLQGHVKYFRNDRFVDECPALDIYFEPFTDIYKNYDLYDFVKLIHSNVSNFRSNNPHLNPNKNHGNNLKVIKKTKIFLPDVKEWLDYEISIPPKSVQVKRYFDELKYFKIDQIKSFRGLAIDKANFIFGRFTNGDDELYIGEYKGSMKNGLGYFCKKDSFSYRGYWKNNSFHGKGVFMKEGVKITGVWENGILIRISNVLIN